MNKRTSILIVCLLILLILPGCWNQRELNTLAIVQAVGIDKTKDDEIILTVQILIPSAIKGGAASSQGGGGGKGVWTLTTRGETVFDAFRNATLETERKLYMPHNKVIVIGEEAAKSGIGPLIDFLHRDHETRHLVKVFIAHGQAKDILEGEHEQEKIPAEAIEGLAEVITASSKIPKRNFFDLVITLDSKTSDPVLPSINITVETKNNQEKKIVSLAKTAIFKKDNLIGWFNEIETRGLLWILGEVKSGIIVVDSPEDENQKVSLEIINASGKVIPKITEDGDLKVIIEVEEEGNLAEQMSQVELTTPENFKELESRQTTAIEEEIIAAVVKAQAWGVDIFKFGEAFHQNFPDEWPELEENWEKKISEITVDVVIDAKLRRNGITSTPILVEQDAEGDQE